MERTFFRVAFTKTLAVAALAFAALSADSQAAVVFDNITNTETSVSGATITATSSAPNTFMGDGYTLTPGTVNITGFDVFPYNNTGTNYTGLQINIYVWGSVNTGTINATTPAFSNLLNTYTLTSTGNFATGSYYTFENATPGSAPGINLATPLVIPGNTVGITISYAGTTGTTYATAQNLTSIISYGTAPTAGSLTLGGTTGGYFRNGNSETNGNFTSGVRSLGFTYQGVALRVFGTVVPEPGTWAMIVIGAGALLVCQVRRRTTAARA